MVSLFSGRVLICNNSDQDELDTVAEVSRRLENRLVLLFFGAAACPKCQAFVPILKDFFVRLTDEFYVLRAAQLALVYVSQDPTEEQQELFLKDMPKKWLFLTFEDDLRRSVLEDKGRPPSGNAMETSLKSRSQRMHWRKCL
ncbi:nucleoredoxin-like protein 1 [Marmota marmota marmota]|nr:nucleoredoxin-like protein 1 [Marmota marmota marmota]